ncbi:exportin-1 emb [Dermatophagoides farinae]|uniref:exportin-1 emb n=1 Tax=Dermatophagoides farinae TaxID=6954 RepID=UPI003F5E81C8
MDSMDSSAMFCPPQAQPTSASPVVGVVNQINGTANNHITMLNNTATSNNTVNQYETLTIESANQLLNFKGVFDIQLLEQVVECLYTTQGQPQKIAQEILTTFKEHPDSWTRVDGILEYAKNKETKYFALQVLENLIKTRWKIIPENQCENIKKFIVALIIKTSTNPISMEQDKVYLNKLNMILVQILKQDWPKKWPNFISDICASSKKSETLCMNNMTILKLLSEELFDFSTGQLTQAKSKHLKDTMCQHFREVFSLCQYVLEDSRNEKLIYCTLETLLRFLNWIPLGYIFETGLINALIFKFFPYDVFRNITLKCLTEIANIGVDSYDEVYCSMFETFMLQLNKILPNPEDLKTLYETGIEENQNFVQNLAMFLSTLLKKRGQLFETEAMRKQLLMAVMYLIVISQVEDVEVFKICLEYWGSLTEQLYKECPLDDRVVASSTIPMRRLIYEEMLSKLRYIMIGRMAKPEEVLVVENEQGEVVREFMKDTDSIQLYNNMRETLVYLTHLNSQDTENIMNEKLKKQVDGTEWSWKNLNTLCWAIGSISGAMLEEEERKFLVTVIKELLGLCEQKRGKDNKAIIASNIMYVVGQYPRFLRAYWKFLKTVVNKLFEFMHETHDGVQDMACDTFIKIANKCRRHFITIQPGEVQPFIDEILENMATVINQLEPHQIHTFYEAVGYMISAQTDEKIQEKLIQNYMTLPNQVWNDIIRKAAINVDFLTDHIAIKQLDNIIKTNYHACKALGHNYILQLKFIYMDMLSLYKVMSQHISAAIAKNGESVMKQPIIRSMRGLKKEILKLINEWVYHSNDHKVVLQSFIPNLLDAILLDYKVCAVPSAREPEVLSTMSTVIKKLTDNITPQIPAIFDAVFECTLEMINKDFEEYPEHRTNFYVLLQQVVTHCFAALLNTLPNQFKLVLDSIIWALKHTMRNVADTGLKILLTLMENMIQQPTEMCNCFYQTYYTDIMQHMFSVVTDTSHSAGLTMQARILAFMFEIVDMNKITAPLNPAIQNGVATAAGGGGGNPQQYDNVKFVKDFVSSLLKSAFSHLNDAQIQVTVQGFFNLNHDVVAFKEHLRDFLVQIREFSGEGDSDLFLEERLGELQKKEEEKRQRQLSVPGIINPYDLPDAMDDN